MTSRSKTLSVMTSPSVLVWVPVGATGCRVSRVAPSFAMYVSSMPCEELRRAAAAVGGVGVAVPLLHPRQHLGQAGDQRHQPLVGPALLLARLDQRRQGERLLGVVPAGPAEQRRRVGLAAGVGIEDEPLLRHVELAAVRPVLRPREVGCRVLRRHRDRPVATAILGPTGYSTGVLTALQVPGRLPRSALTQAGVLVAVRREDTAPPPASEQLSRLVDDRNVATGPPTAPARGRAQRRGRPRRPARRRFLAVGRPCLVEPEPPILQPVQQPTAQRPLLLLLPRLDSPPPLVLGLLEQADKRYGSRIRLDPPLNQCPVIRRPVRPELRDRRRPVPVIEPAGPPCPLGQDAGQQRSRKHAHRAQALASRRPA